MTMLSDHVLRAVISAPSGSLVYYMHHRHRSRVVHQHTAKTAPQAPLGGLYLADALQVDERGAAQPLHDQHPLGRELAARPRVERA